MITKNIHISAVKSGDTIFHGGEIKTLSATFINRGGFMGDTIWGDSYDLGTKPVVLIVKL